MKEYISPGIATKPKSAILFYKMPKSEFIETNIFRIIKIKMSTFLSKLPMQTLFRVKREFSKII